ncbi:TolB family protein [Thermodesulfobacteriota bacterium B35]
MNRSPIMAMKWMVILLLSVAMAAAVAGCGNGDEAPRDSGPFAGLHYRVVWVQDAAQNRDVFCQGNALRLMALDSRQPGVERQVVPGNGSFVKPLLSADGSRIVYSSRLDADRSEVWLVNWDGSDRQRIARGRALALWRDPATGREWLYFQKNPAPGRPADTGILFRRPLEAGAGEERVWPGREIRLSQDTLQLAADGSRAAGLFPWPRAGVVGMADGRIRIYDRGCWTALAPDNSYLFWVFQDNHRRLTMVDTRGTGRWQVDISGAPLISGHEVYHPRWSNNRRYLAISGPYTIMHGGNAIRGGGETIEILIGRFNSGLRAIEAWQQVTRNRRADFFPDLWVDPRTTAAR